MCTCVRCLYILLCIYNFDLFIVTTHCLMLLFCHITIVILYAIVFAWLILITLHIRRSFDLINTCTCTILFAVSHSQLRYTQIYIYTWHLHIYAHRNQQQTSSCTTSEPIPLDSSSSNAEANTTKNIILILPRLFSPKFKRVSWGCEHECMCKIIRTPSNLITYMGIVNAMSEARLWFAQLLSHHSYWRICVHSYRTTTDRMTNTYAFATISDVDYDNDTTTMMMWICEWCKPEQEQQQATAMIMKFTWNSTSLFMWLLLLFLLDFLVSLALCQRTTIAHSTHRDTHAHNVVGCHVKRKRTLVRSVFVLMALLLLF